MQSALCRLLSSTAAVAVMTVFAMPLDANAEPQSAPYAAQTIGNPTPPAAPVHPFYAELTITNSLASAGPPRGKLAITNLTLTNFDTSAQQVFIFAPIFAAGGNCGEAVIGGAAPQMTVYVQPAQTLVIPYPTPLVFGASRPNCIAAEVVTILHGGSVQINANGFFQ